MGYIGKKPSGISIFKALIVGLSLMFLGMFLGLFALGLLGMLLGTFFGLSIGLSLGTKLYLPNRTHSRSHSRNYSSKDSSAKIILFLTVFFVTLILIFSFLSMTLYSTPENKSHFVEVYVYYEGNWNGALGYGSTITSESGYGNGKFWGNLTDGTPVSITAQKYDDSNKELRVEIYVDGLLRAQAHTTSPYGLATTSCTI